MSRCTDGCLWIKKHFNVAILNVKGVDFKCILLGIIKKEAVDILKNSVLEDKGVL